MAAAPLRARHTLAAVLGVAAAASMACQRDYQFKTTAVYRMTDERCTVRVETHGLVRAGADLSRDAEGQLILERTGAPPFQLPIVLVNGETTVEAARGAEREQFLGSLFAGAGCTVSPAEVTEILGALEGALSGPKGTIMDGQTKLLKVTSVTFDR